MLWLSDGGAAEQGSRQKTEARPELKSYMDLSGIALISITDHDKLLFSAISPNNTASLGPNKESGTFVKRRPLADVLLTLVKRRLAFSCCFYSALHLLLLSSRDSQCRLFASGFGRYKFRPLKVSEKPFQLLFLNSGDC